MKKIVTMALLASAALWGLGCASTGKTDGTALEEEFASVRQAVIKDSRAIEELHRSEVAPETGYYYILNRQGRIIHHPNKILVGANFSTYPFIKEIIARGAGCLHHGAGEASLLMIFRPLGNGEILCLSVNTREVKSLTMKCDALVDEL